MRISDWSSDVCSSDLIVNVPKRGLGDKAVGKLHMLARAEGIPLSLAAARILDTEEVTTQARRSLGNFIGDIARRRRSEEHTSELQSLMRISYAVFCLTKI